MISVQTIAMIFSAWLVVSSILRIKRAAGREKVPVEGGKRIRGALPALLNYVGAILVAAGIAMGAGAFLQSKELNFVYVFTIILFLTTSVDTIVAFKYPDEFKHAKLLAPVATLVISFGFFIYVALMLSAPGSASEQVHLAYPVKGNWRVYAGGRFKITNYHHDNPPAQSYAVDMSCPNAEGRMIYAPIEGVIIQAVGDRTDESKEAEGNCVAIQCENGTQIWMAHLAEGSVVVKKGDRVATGQPIGACGMTGSATSPHLHIHAQLGERPAPMVFKGKFLIMNDRFTAF